MLPVRVEYGLSALPSNTIATCPVDIIIRVPRQSIQLIYTTRFTKNVFSGGHPFLSTKNHSRAIANLRHLRQCNAKIFICPQNIIFNYQTPPTTRIQKALEHFYMAERTSNVSGREQSGTTRYRRKNTREILCGRQGPPINGLDPFHNRIMPRKPLRQSFAPMLICTKRDQVNRDMVLH